jgi:lysyl-tRNA synthetase class 2
MKEKRSKSTLALANMLPASILKSRALMLSQARAFFESRGIVEVDPCALSVHAAIASNIDVIAAEISPQKTGYLHTSPEYAMKRLLAHGSGDIYFLGHVFRQGEIGRLHAPEFTMAEWYRLKVTFDEMIQETCDFISLFLGDLPIRKIGYREAFETYVDIDYAQAPLETLLTKAKQFGVSPEAFLWPRSALIHFLLTHAIEPHLGRNELTILCDYPPDEAALAQLTERNGELVAERFEAYNEGVELSNGYHELPDGQELRRRFTQENDLRIKAGKPAYALDEEFLASLTSSFPDCCGVSVGFDRLFLLQQKAKALSEVLPFAWTTH